MTQTILFGNGKVVTKYQERIPGSLLDKIGIHFEVLRVDYPKLKDNITLLHRPVDNQ